MYFANRGDVKPGKADVTLKGETLILKPSAKSVNQKERLG